MNTRNDKVVVILGASSGLGEAAVRLLAGKTYNCLVIRPTKQGI